MVMSETKKINSKQTISTLHFGEIEVEKSHVFSFQEGILGFEELHDFVLISHEDTFPLKWLVSMSDPNIGFAVLSPYMLDINYKADRSVNVDKDVLFVIVTLAHQGKNMTANMKAPVILDVKSQTGRQIILTSDKYSTDYVISNK